MCRAAKSSRKGRSRSKRSVPAIPLHLRRTDPFAPPDRRWQLACFYAESHDANQRDCEDGWIAKAVDHLTNAVVDEDVAQAAVLAQSLSPADRGDLAAFLVCQELAARLLAGQTNAEISQCLRVSAGIVETFEALHFAVRDKLQFKSKIFHTAIGPEGHEGLARLGHLWKSVGYFAGPVVLDVFIAAFHQFPAELQSRGIYAYLKGDCPRQLKLFIQVRLLDTSAPTILKDLAQICAESEIALREPVDWAAYRSAVQADEACKPAAIPPAAIPTVPAAA